MNSRTALPKSFLAAVYPLIGGGFCLVGSNMKSNSKSLVAIAILASSLTAPSALIVSDYYLKLNASDGGLSTATTVEDTVFPAVRTFSNTDGPSFSSATFTLNSELILVDTTQSWTNRFSSTYMGMTLTLDQPYAYSISGDYTLEDIDGAVTRLELSLSDLGDPNVGNYVFQSIQQSIGTPDAHFSVGGTDGNDQSILSGSQNGVLPSGEYYYEVELTTSNDRGVAISHFPITASGGVVLNFTPIPEPATATFAILGILACARRRRDP